MILDFRFMIFNMKVSFYGAAHQVTGSCHLVETKGKKILLDCGMFQGGDFNEGKNNDAFPFDPASVDAVLVSHGHLDHTGRIPKLVKEGCKGSIYGTKATLEFARLIWDDAQHIMTYNNKKFQAPILYMPEDIDIAEEQCQGVDYHEIVDLGDGVTAVFKDAGHIFGSSFIELTADGKTLGFSGDMGNKNVPILKESEQLGNVDALLCESTYGDRIHEDLVVRRDEIVKLMKEGYEGGGTVMVPAFSLERTQEFLYELHKLNEEGRLPNVPIFLDSPLAIRALPVYKKYSEYYDKEALKHHSAGEDFLDFPQLTITESKEESMKINEMKGPKMVIAGAGMMNGGRILHHAFRYLSDPNSMLLIVGYQAHGTLGRRLYEGAKKVHIFNQEIEVNATVKAIGALSAHGDQNKLVEWIGGAETVPKKVFFIHGEKHAANKLAGRVNKELKIETFVPEEGEVFEI
jgi:metallo-beta-lactamase family protein